MRRRTDSIPPISLLISNRCRRSKLYAATSYACANGFVPYTMPSQYPPQRPQNSDTFAPYDGVSTSEKADGLGYAGYSYPQNPTQSVFTEEQKRSATYYADRAAATYDEKPRIFRLRSNPNMLVYEYSDRLDYYKKDGDYRQFLYSEKRDNVCKIVKQA